VSTLRLPMFDYRAQSKEILHLGPASCLLQAFRLPRTSCSHALLLHVPQSSSSKIRASGRRLNVFNDTGTIKNEAPAADPSVCAANGLVCGAG
jgi:hypothetical protein